MPADADSPIAFVLRLPFAEQIAFFRAKLGNLVPTATWRDIMRAQHDRAFMVAGAAKADLLADLAEAVDKAIADGESLDKFRARFGEIVQKRGWQGWTGSESKAGRNWRTRVIYRTNLSTSYAAGRLAQLKEYPLWVYKHSGAEHPRLQHKAWDGLTLPAGHPFWKTHYPPNGWGCGCRVVGARDGAGAARLGAKPGYTSPPAGWDVPGATGRLPGIDEGWDYQPGATVTQMDRARSALADKLDQLPAPLARELTRDLAHPVSADAEPEPAQAPRAGADRVFVEVVRSTRKAHLVRAADGREAWIQARWLRDDGSVSASTFARQADEMAGRARDLAARRAFKDGFHEIGAVARETEKAVAVEAAWEEHLSGQGGTRLVWFPKSQLRGGKLPGWLIEAKARELRESLTTQAVAMRISLCGREFWM